MEADKTDLPQTRLYSKKVKKVIRGLLFFLLILVVWQLIPRQRQIKRTIQIRKQCMLADAYIFETPFSPSRYSARIKGELKGNARVYLTFRSKGSPELTGGWIDLKSGRVDTTDVGVLYERIFSVIYVPEMPVETSGNLTVDLEIE